MRRQFVLVFLGCFITVSSYAQDFSDLWQGHFSYFNIIDITKSDSKIYAASQNAIFSFDINSNTIDTITTINGLSGEAISTIEYSEAFQLLLIGFENGLVEIYFESDQSILSVVDIVEEIRIDPTTKTINDFNEHDGFAYIATDFGISVYDLQRLEFGDSFFIGNSNTQIPVEKTAVFNNSIYAACSQGNGLRSAALSNPNLIDAQQWQTVTSGSFSSVETAGNSLLALNTNRVLSEVVNNTLTPVMTFANLPVDSEVSNNQLIYTASTSVFIYDANTALVAQINPTTDFESNFTSAITFGETTYIGTQTLGLLKTTTSSTPVFESIKPDGPLQDIPFKIQAFREGLWVTYGAYDGEFNPFPLNERGVSVLDQNQWRNIPFDSLLGMRELNTITINPFNTSQVFVSSFIDGLLEFEDFEAVNFFDQANSPLVNQDFGIPGNIDVRVGASAFDANGNLWNLQSRVNQALKSYNPQSGNWQLYDFSPIIPDVENDDRAFTAIAIDNATGIKWVGAESNGLIAFNETQSGALKKIDSEQNGLPFPFVTALALDNSSRLWIGTAFGLRVLFDTSNNFFSDEAIEVQPIIFEEDGLARELLENQFVTDIEVDGANNKWLGTFDSGAFYVTPDGQTTIRHFTKNNSPLPSNEIRDISIDQSNGTVYFATPNGLVSFRWSGGSEPQEDLESAYAYPNPVRPEYAILGSSDLNDITKGVKVVGLTDNVNIKITDIEGNLVTEAQSRVNRRNSNINYNFAIEGGTAIWNGRNLANNVVASGVYLIIISDLDTFEDKVIKLLVIR